MLRSKTLRDLSFLTPALVLVTASTNVRAGEGERPPTWNMSVEELQTIGLGQYRGDPVPVPSSMPHERAPNDPVEVKQGVIFVNFDGANLSSGPDDSRANTTQIGQLAGAFPAYGNGAKRDAVLQAVRDDWAAYNVIVTDARPASGDYTMNMIGPTNPFGNGVLGIAPLDCNDAQTHNNITYAFHSINDQFAASVQATTVGQEVAHSYGLEHVDEPGDIMNPYNAGGDPAFMDACIQIVSNQGIACGSQHAAACGTSSSQNAHQELLDIFGPSAPDTQAPVVEIVAPQDGDVFDVGATFDIEVVANDDNAVEFVQLFNNGEALEMDASQPYGWGVGNIPEGIYELYVEAHDLAGNTAMSNVVTITVGDPPSQGDESGGSDGGTGGGTDGGTGALPDSGGENSDDGGCGCRESPASPGLTVLAFLGLAAIRRR